MAILQPFECTVEVDGVALQEYEDEEIEQANTTTSVSKYIEAVSGANFSLKFILQPGWTMKADYIIWFLALDGKSYGGSIIRSESYDGARSCTSVRSGVVSGSGDNWTQRKFTFADLVVGEKPGDLELEEVKERYEWLGHISVHIWRMKLLGQNDRLEETRHSPLSVIPEKALKGQALSLSTDLGPLERIQKRYTTLIGEKIEDYPVAAFHFKYRSRESLKQLLVIPRSPSPTPLEERNPEDLTPAEAQELIRRQRVQLAEIQAIKKEGKLSNKRDRRSTEGPTRPTKLVRAASGHLYPESQDSSDDVEIVKVQSRSAQKLRPPVKIEVIDLLD